MIHTNKKKQAAFACALLLFLMQEKNAVVCEILAQTVEKVKKDLKGVLKDECRINVNKFVHEMMSSWTSYVLGEKKTIVIHFHEDWVPIIGEAVLVNFFTGTAIDVKLNLAEALGKFFSSEEGKGALLEFGVSEENARDYLTSLLVKGEKEEEELTLGDVTLGDWTL